MYKENTLGQCKRNCRETLKNELDFGVRNLKKRKAFQAKYEVLPVLFFLSGELPSPFVFTYFFYLRDYFFLRVPRSIN